MVDDVARGFDVPSPDDPVEALAAVVALRRLADQLEQAAVEHAIDRGWTWSQVAQALGVTKQAVHKKFAHRIGRR
jgi:AraC-like DNA-binding protein